MANAGRFSECTDCTFHNRRRENPLCGECTAGEFFEERIRVRALDHEEAMTEFGRMTSER